MNELNYAENVVIYNILTSNFIAMNKFLSEVSTILSLDIIESS